MTEHLEKELNQETIKDLLANEEGQQLEVKKGQGHDELMKSVCAFSNTNSGIVLIGIDSTSKKVLGTPAGEHEREKLSGEIDQSLQPRPNYKLYKYLVDGQEIIALIIEYNPSSLTYYKGVAYKRVDSRDIMMHPHDITAWHVRAKTALEPVTKEDQAKLVDRRVEAVAGDREYHFGAGKSFTIGLFAIPIDSDQDLFMVSEKKRDELSKFILDSGGSSVLVPSSGSFPWNSSSKFIGEDLFSYFTIGFDYLYDEILISSSGDVGLIVEFSKERFGEFHLITLKNFIANFITFTQKIFKGAGQTRFLFQIRTGGVGEIGLVLREVEALDFSDKRKFIANRLSIPKDPIEILVTDPTEDVVDKLQTLVVERYTE